MRLSYNKKSSEKIKSRMKKRVRIRKKVFGTEERPRLTVFRTARHIYAQIIDDALGKTIVQSSTIVTEVGKSKGSRDAAKAIGIDLAKKAKEKNITAVVFDRSGFLYHGRVKALADAAREAGLQF
ncbi:MAG: 50S ribosomal protein L18 [Bdellovibrionales bacterium]|nr:50S ribosomal protein L18 [Bdellovibrionales bacterium]